MITKKRSSLIIRVENVDLVSCPLPLIVSGCITGLIESGVDRKLVEENTCYKFICIMEIEKK